MNIAALKNRISSSIFSSIFWKILTEIESKYFFFFKKVTERNWTEREKCDFIWKKPPLIFFGFSVNVDGSVMSQFIYVEMSEGLRTKEVEIAAKKRRKSEMVLSQKNLLGLICQIKIIYMSIKWQLQDL